MENTMFSAGSLHKHIKAGSHGAAVVVHDSPDKFTRMRAAMHGQPLDCDTYTRLLVNDRLWMTDADFEWRSNLEVVHKAHGNVLIAGLGLGFIIRPMLASDKVSSVTVLEKDADVIALIQPQIAHDKLNVIHADALAWEPLGRSKKAFDCVYLDIWADIPNSDQWGQIKALKRKYRRALRVGGWIGAWCEDRARRGH